MRKREIFMLSALSFSMGIVLGVLISPAKNGVGNNSGNNIKNYYYCKPSKDEESWFSFVNKMGHVYFCGRSYDKR